jgi:NADH-quinone oxidoreductase subunit L
MFRLIFLTFCGEERMDEHTRHHLRESPRNVVYPLVVLAFLAIVGGYVGLPAWTGATNLFEHFMEPVLRIPEGAIPAAGEHAAGAEITMTLFSILAAGIGIFLAYRFYIVDPAAPGRFTSRFRNTYTAVFNKYYVDQLYDALFVNRTKDLGNACFFVDSQFVDGAVNGTAASTRGTATISRLFDTYVVDGLVNLIGWINMKFNSLATSLQTGMVQRYALGAVFGIIVFIIIFYGEFVRL